jgi:hypothetical protein
MIILPRIQISFDAGKCPKGPWISNEAVGHNSAPE